MIRRPGRNARSEKIIIFGPDRDAERKRCRQDRPIIEIPLYQALSGCLFKRGVRFKLDRLNNLFERVQKQKRGFNRNTALPEDCRKMFPRFSPGSVGRVEPGGSVPRKQSSHTRAQHGANQDVRINDEHFSVCLLALRDAPS